MKRWISFSLMVLSLLSTGCAVRASYRDDYHRPYVERGHDRDDFRR